MLIAVTNRHLCQDNFQEHIEKIVCSHPDALILREKDLTAEEYQILAHTCSAICEKHGVQFIAHNFINVALKMELSCLQLTMSAFIAYQRSDHHCSDRLDEKTPQQYEPLDTEFDPCPHFSPSAQPIRIGVSVHNTKDAVMAERYGASYVVAGHIFATNSKKGAAPRGLAFLKDVCRSVTIPVYAIGGITPNNIHYVIETGAQGACVMSPLMTATQPEELIAAYRKTIDFCSPYIP